MIFSAQNRLHNQHEKIGQILYMHPVKRRRVVELEAVAVPHNTAHESRNDEACLVEQPCAFAEDARSVQTHGLESCVFGGGEDGDLSGPLRVWITLVYGFEKVVRCSRVAGVPFPGRVGGLGQWAISEVRAAREVQDPWRRAAWFHTLCQTVDKSFGSVCDEAGSGV